MQQVYDVPQALHKLGQDHYVHHLQLNTISNHQCINKPIILLNILSTALLLFKNDQNFNEIWKFNPDYIFDKSLNNLGTLFTAFQ